MTDLKKCPFCGGEAEHPKIYDGTPAYGKAFCQNGCIGYPMDEREIQSGLWNTRPLESALQQKLDKAKAFIKRASLLQICKTEATRLLKELEENDRHN